MTASTVRVTQKTLNTAVGANLQANLSRLADIQEQLSSGKVINRPSDSPTDTVAALRYRADIRRSEQLKRNAEDAKGWLNQADGTLSNASTALNRVRELVVGSVNGSLGPQERDAAATEIASLRDQLMSAANTTYLGRPIFAGTANTTTAYDINGNYQGNTGSVGRMVAPNVNVPINLDGPSVFGPAGSSLFDNLTSIVNDLRTNNQAGLATDQNSLDTAFQRINTAQATIGARTNHVESMEAHVDSSVQNSTEGLSNVEDIDLPKTIVNLQMQQVAYQAALSATAKVIQPSLVDFLR